jgi:hypothetical protein
VIFLITFGHAVFYIAPSLYLPLEVDALFLLGYALVLADSGLVICLGIKLLARLLAGNDAER